MSQKKREFTQTIVPRICQPKKDEGGETESVPAYKGHVVLVSRSFEERMAFSDEFYAEERAADAKDPDGAAQREKDRGSRWWRFLARKVPPYVREVKLTRVADGQEFTSWEEVEHESALGAAVVEVALALEGRSVVGNPSEPSC